MEGGQWLTQHPQGCWKEGGLESSGCQSLRSHRHKGSKSTLILGSGALYFRAPHSFLHPQVNQEQLGAGLQGFAHCLLCVTSRSGWADSYLFQGVPPPGSFPWLPSFSLLGSGPYRTLLKTLLTHQYCITSTA